MDLKDVLMTGEMKIDELRANHHLFMFFIQNFLSLVIGWHQFNKSKCSKVVSEYSTISDEAYTVLALENSVEMWTEDISIKFQTMSQDLTTDQKKALPKKKYTANAAAAKKYGGWTEEGRKCFNSLCQQVQKARDDACDTEIEDWL